MSKDVMKYKPLGATSVIGKETARY
jgi:hypothetical protein